MVASLAGASTLPAAATQRVQFDRRPANAQVLYVSDLAGPVYEFAAGTGVLLATITDGIVPTGLDVDSTGTLYVSEHGSSTINEYTPGATTATTVLSDGLNSPYGAAHCLDGTTYVANVFDGNANGNITYYAAGATTPTGAIPDANLYNALGVACDPNSNAPSGEPCRLCSRFPGAWLRGSERGSASRHSSPLNGGNPRAGTVFRANVRNQLLTESYGAGVLSQPVDTFIYPGGNT